MGQKRRRLVEVGRSASDRYGGPGTDSDLLKEILLVGFDETDHI